jgi:hypothetical protein
MSSLAASIAYLVMRSKLAVLEMEVSSKDDGLLNTDPLYSLTASGHKITG